MEKEKNSKEFEQGFENQRNGGHVSACPYPEGTKESEDWLDGHECSFWQHYLY